MSCLTVKLLWGEDMKIEKIKPIPKYILNRIKKRDKQVFSTPCGYTRYYSYLTKNDGELVKVTVAVRHKNANFYYKQCTVHGIKSDKCFVKDMGFTCLAGYRVGWFSEGLTKYPKWYEDDDWGWADDKYFRVYSTCVNIEYALKQDKYKYSACDKTREEIISYLRLYEEFPQVEYLVKAGLHNIATSKPILRRIATDKGFCKWLMANKQKLQKYNFYKDVVSKSYTSDRNLDELQKEKRFKLTLVHDENYKYLLKNYDKTTLKKMVKYVEKQNISFATYRDYLNACNYLGLDMMEDKNLIPHNFMRWHDIRTDEYHTAKALKDAEERKELYDSFAAIAEKYLCLQHNGKQGFIAVIAKSPAELIAEGESLHHCVGRMNYDQKFVREESLIFFIRTKDQPDTPFVTVEYSPKMQKILQLHGDHNATPDEKTTNYIIRIWLPYANKQLRKIQSCTITNVA